MKLLLGICFVYLVTQRLSDRWTVVHVAEQTSDGDEEQEVIDSSVLRLLTKEYLEVLHRLLERSATNDQFNGGPEDQMDMDSEMGGEDGEGSSRPPKPKNPNPGCIYELGEVGLALLNDPTCFSSIIHLAAMYDQ